jgi:DNA-binding GntR family transcriptional regulator
LFGDSLLWQYAISKNLIKMTVDKVINTNQEIDQSSRRVPHNYVVLNHGLVQAEFRPVERVSGVATARQLVGNRQPVTETFIRLQSMGPLDVRPQRGTDFLTRLTSKFVSRPNHR